MNQREVEIAEKLFNKKFEQLGEREKHAAQHLSERTHITKNGSQDYSEQMTFGQRLADKVAAFGGSRTFISIFAVVLVNWILLNSIILIRYSSNLFDPYPYILLNLLLSMLAAIQAPIILTAQTRQACKDRLSAEHYYEVNLKAELEIMLLNEKMTMREKQWGELISMQQEQIRLLSQLTNDPKNNH
jgi:uncharacterized membrane protein